MKHAVDRLPPHSIEAEQGILGCLMLDPNRNIPEMIEHCRGRKELFYDLRHQRVYDAIERMYDAGQMIDMVTLQQRLKDDDALEAVGGLAYLMELQDMAPSAAAMKHYLAIATQKRVLRRIIQECSEIAAGLYDDRDIDTQTALDDTERRIQAIRGEFGEQGERKPIKTLVTAALNQLEAWHQNKGVVRGLSTGFYDLDKMTHGLKPGEVWVVAGRPGLGKSSLAMNIVERVAVDDEMPVGVFSLEMTAEALAMRLLCSRARVSQKNAQDGFLSEGDFPKLTAAAIKLVKSRLHIDAIADLTIAELRARARRMKTSEDIRLLVIDYLQLMRGMGHYRSNRQEEVSEVSRGIKTLALELRIPILLLSQLNRELDKETRKPRLSDIRESGAVEQDADLVAFLYKPQAGEDGVSEDDSEACPMNLLIAKHREGPTGDIHLTFLKPFTRFESAAKV